ncbi:MULTISPECIES: helix-turn-helix domain-containing protein [unclassified Sphingomonas]|uniref:helix-turn-helix domain-containing protein n=1 Tax=unclassified Sphingomonas TaxID=196159 RepID=UPI00268F0C4D
MSDIVDDDSMSFVPVLPFAPEQFQEIRHCALGVKLRAARLAANLSIEAVSERTRIRAVYLSALEEGRLDQFTAPLYAVGFASSYARAIGLDAEWAAQAMRQFIADTPNSWRRSGWVH